MTTIQKFQFDVSFDAEDSPEGRKRKKAAEPEVPPPPPPPTYSEEELARTRAKAYAEGRAKGDAEGYERGRSEAEGEIGAAMTAAMVRLADGIERIMADRDELNADRTGQPARIAMAVIGKLFPATLRRHGTRELEEFITACVNEAIDEPRLTIRVNDGLTEELRARVEELAAQRGFAGRLVVVGDTALGPSDARIEWTDGGAERNTRHLLADIERTAERLLAMPPMTDAETPDDQDG